MRLAKAAHYPFFMNYGMFLCYNRRKVNVRYYIMTAGAGLDFSGKLISPGRIMQAEKAAFSAWRWRECF